MAQDNANEPTVAEEPEVSDQSQVGDPAGAQTTGESQIAEPVLDDAEDDVAEEEAGVEDAAREETTETESPSQDDTEDGAPSSSATPLTQTTANADTDERCDIERQPYDCAPHHAA